MTATDELRRMLDERGVEHRDRYSHTKGRENPGTRFTTWFVNRDNARFTARADEHDDYEFGLFFSVEGYRVTPEQAIEATLGRGTCRDLAETPKYGDKTRFECSACGYEYSAVGGFGCDYGDEPDFRYCPNCGREVVEQ